MTCEIFYLYRILHYGDVVLDIQLFIKNRNKQSLQAAFKIIWQYKSSKRNYKCQEQIFNREEK